IIKKKNISLKNKVTYSILITISICIFYPLSSFYLYENQGVIKDVIPVIFVNSIISIVIEVIFISIYKGKYDERNK
ncbi:TPA: hypothetical protein ACPZJF_004537, partial [Yersinia enterocolitica]